MRRRQFLTILGTAAVSTVLGGCTATGGGSTEPNRTWRPVNPLVIPPELTASGEPPRYGLLLRTGSTAFVPGRPTPTWGVNGSYLGPTLRLRQGEHVAMEVRNALPETTTLHWHGLRVPATADGGPHQPIPPTATWSPEFDVVNAACTAWYHPHPHGTSAQHVFRGVAGLIIVEDDASRALDLPHAYGVDDLPVVLQDRTLDDQGQLVWKPGGTFGQLGTDMLVNGTLDAYVSVRTTRVRLRLLNASNARRYHLGFADGRHFALIATDDGLLEAPVELERVSLGPAERAEVVVTVAPGERVVLDSVSGDEEIDQGRFPLLELRADAQLRSSPPLPDHLGGQALTPPAPDAAVRHFVLQGHDAINGQEMDLRRIDEVVPAGAVEVWEIENTVYAHNFHVHGVEFAVLDRDGRPPEAYERGLKDTVHLPAKTKVRLAVRIGTSADPTHPYMYHCHILRHEDAGMMGQFVVVPPGTEANVSRTLPPTGDPSGHHTG